MNELNELKKLAKAKKNYLEKVKVFEEKTGVRVCEDYNRIQLFLGADILKNLGGEKSEREDEYHEWKLFIDDIEYLSLIRKESK